MRSWRIRSRRPKWAIVGGKLYVNNNAFAKTLWDQASVRRWKEYARSLIEGKRAAAVMRAPVAGRALVILGRFGILLE
ncbi:MAG: hypothetical protein NVS9B2_24670 [Steroidobacteraceae bacterium]